jgi:hypothetical protein
MKSVFSNEYDIFRRCMITARKEAQLTQERLAKSLKKTSIFILILQRWTELCIPALRNLSNVSTILKYLV